MVSSNTEEVVIGDDASELLSDEFINSNPRLSVMVRRCSHHMQDIMQIKQTATQLVHGILDEAISICMVFHGKDSPLPVRLHVYDPADPKIRALYETRGFKDTVQLRSHDMLTRFISQWVFRRRKLKFCLSLYNHWTTKIERKFDEPDKQHKTASHIPTIRYQDLDNLPKKIAEHLDAQDIQHTFVFQAKFSAPMRQCPTPQCTANVYFWFQTIEFDYTTKERSVFLPFHYHFEDRVFMHQPSVHGHAFNFQENVLLGILDAKSKMYAALDF